MDFERYIVTSESMVCLTNIVVEVVILLECIIGDAIYIVLKEKWGIGLLR